MYDIRFIHVVISILLFMSVLKLIKLNCFLLDQSTHFALAFEVPGGWHKEKEAIKLTVIQVLKVTSLQLILLHIYDMFIHVYLVMYVYMYIYKYVHTYVYILMYLYTYICTHLDNIFIWIVFFVFF